MEKSPDDVITYTEKVWNQLKTAMEATLIDTECKQWYEDKLILISGHDANVTLHVWGGLLVVVHPYIESDTTLSNDCMSLLAMHSILPFNLACRGKLQLVELYVIDKLL